MHKRQDVSKVYRKSLVAYTVISYLLGFGDRHKDNIMMSETGHFFHIGPRSAPPRFSPSCSPAADYGYVLGQDVKPMMPWVAFTRDMVHPNMRARHTHTHTHIVSFMQSS